jgi:hypothetical protein
VIVPPAPIRRSLGVKTRDNCTPQKCLMAASFVIKYVDRVH